MQNYTQIKYKGTKLIMNNDNEKAAENNAFFFTFEPI